MTSTHIKLFIGHKKPDFPMWRGFKFIDELLKDISLESCTISGFNYTDDKIINEYASVFILRRYLEQKRINSGIITLCQHRRFVLNRNFGEVSKNQPWTHVMATDAAASLDTEQLILPRPGAQNLISSVISLPNGLLWQYARHHHVRDFMRFVAALIDHGILSSSAAENFVRYTWLAPAPSCGTFDVKLFLSISQTLENAATAFWKDGYKPYDDPYQSRVFGFLLERLNSFLLLENLKLQNLDFNNEIGFSTTVSDTAQVKPGLY